MIGPNPYRDAKPWGRVKIGGREIVAVLKLIDGNEIEDEWNVQKGTNTNKATAVYRGEKLIEGVVLTFEATDEESFDDLAELWAMLAPAKIGGAAGGRPPTLPIENAALTWIGLTSINRKKWKGPYPTDTGSWRVDLTVIQSSPPTPAAVGKQDPSKKGSTAPGAVDPQIAALQKERDALFAQAAAV